MKKVYISGAIAHHDLIERKAAFKAVERELADMGFIPINPFDNGVPDEAHYTHHMKADIKMLCECDMIYMMKGWEYSKGAKLEHDVATSIGLKVFKYE